MVVKIVDGQKLNWSSKAPNHYKHFRQNVSSVKYSVYSTLKSINFHCIRRIVGGVQGGLFLPSPSPFSLPLSPLSLSSPSTFLPLSHPLFSPLPLFSLPRPGFPLPPTFSPLPPLSPALPPPAPRVSLTQL